jgi:hypothetical protein
MTGEEIVALLVWHAFLALVVLILYAISIAAGATLELSSSVAGSGAIELAVSGDWINASGNATAWQVQVGGMA